MNSIYTDMNNSDTPFRWAFKCRKIHCYNPTAKDFSCCSIKCREEIPSCIIESCEDIVTYKIDHDCNNPSGKLIYDKVCSKHSNVPLHSKSLKKLFVLTNEGWILLNSK